MKKSIPFLLAFFYFLSVNYLFAAETYTLYDLGPKGYNSSVATAINNNGVVVGYVMEDDWGHKAFKWEDGIGSLLATSDSIAYSINDNNEIVGFTTSSLEFASVWHSDGRLEQIANEWTTGTDINNKSQITIQSTDYDPVAGNGITIRMHLNGKMVQYLSLMI